MIVGIALGAWCLASVPIGVAVGKLLARRSASTTAAARPARAMAPTRRESVAAR